MVFKDFKDLSQFVRENGFDNLTGICSSDSLLTSPGNLVIPISRRSGNSMQVLRIRAQDKNVIGAVLWDCIYGQPRGFHYLILFEMVNRSTYYDELLQGIFDLMMIINNFTSSDGNNYNQFINQRSKSVRQLYGIETANLYKEVIHRFSKIRIPDKKPALKIHLSFETLRFKKSPEIRFIGVGYKDKGTLPLPGSSYEPTEYNLNSPDPIFLWNKLLKTYKSTFKLP